MPTPEAVLLQRTSLTEGKLLQTRKQSKRPAWSTELATTQRALPLETPLPRGTFPLKAELLRRQQLPRVLILEAEPLQRASPREVELFSAGKLPWGSTWEAEPLLMWGQRRSRSLRGSCLGERG